MGHLELAHDYAYEAAQMDLGDIHHDSKDGLHRATYTLLDGTDSSVVFRHNGEQLTVTTGESVTQRISKRHPMLPRPPQPPGREPTRRSATLTPRPSAPPPPRRVA